VPVLTGVPSWAAASCSRCVRSKLDRTAWASFDPLLYEVGDAAREQLGEDAYRVAGNEGAATDVDHMLRGALESVASSR
jgi:hypothetical protein